MTLMEKLESLLTASNTTTGISDTDLTNAVLHLISGYGGGGGGHIVTSVTVDLSSETWENRNFCFGTVNTAITCNKIVEIPQNAVSVSISVELQGGNRADTCIQCFANASQQASYDVTDSSTYTNDDYADGWQSNDSSVHDIANISDRYSFYVAILKYPSSSRYYISPSDVVSCTVKFYCVI